jgi:hypothetical protein
MDGFPHAGVCGQTGICDFCFNCTIGTGVFEFVYQGTNTYEVLWLWWFYLEGEKWTPLMRQQAKDHANLVLLQKFVNRPLTEDKKNVYLIK